MITDKRFNFLVSVVSRLGEFSEKSKTLNAALKDLAEYAGVEHAFLFLFNDDKSISRDVYSYTSKPFNINMLPIDFVKGFEWGINKIIAGQVVYIKEPGDLPVSESEQKNIFIKCGVTSILEVPVKAGDEVLGFICLVSHQKNMINADTFEVVIVFTKIINNIFEMKIIEDALRKSARELSVRNQLAEAFLTQKNENLYMAILQIFFDLTNSKQGAVGVTDGADGYFVYRLLRTKDAGGAVLVKTSEFDSVLQEVIKQKKIIVSNTRTEIKSIMLLSENMAALPVHYKKKVIGFVVLGNKLYDYTNSDIKECEVLCETMSHMLNAWLERESFERERVNNEKILRESEEKYHNLFEQSRDAVFILSNDYKIVDVNNQGVLLSDMGSKEEIIGNPLFEKIFKIIGDEKSGAFEWLKKNVSFNDLELSLETLKNKKISALVSSNPVKSKTNVVFGSQVIIKDTTIRKNLEQQLFQSRKMESIGRLAGGIAHDFNNLTCGIMGHASLIKEDITKEHPFYESVDIIESSSRRAAELTAQLLAFARGGKYNIEPVNINDIVRETLRLVGATFDKKIEVVTRLDENVPIIDADSTQMQQVLMNLCVNARDAMPDGGELTITTYLYTKDDSDDVELPGGMNKGSYVVLTVSDNGTGMDKDTLNKIFEPFFTTKEKGKGTGLGLSMVYGVVNNHGGVIDVWSEKGKGSKFSVFLPVGKRQDSDIRKHENVGRASGKNELILVVDDEPSILSLLKKMLENNSYRVLTAQSGQEAVDIIEKEANNISLVVLDMIMPGIRGYELYKKMRSIKSDINVVLSSGYAQDYKAQEILDNGAKGFIQKPFETNDFLHKIRELLDSNHV